MEKIKTTPEIREAKRLVDAFSGNTNTVLKGSLFNSVSMEDKILYIKEQAKARTKLWEAVYKTYPELMEKNIAVGEFEITINKD